MSSNLKLSKAKWYTVITALLVAVLGVSSLAYAQEGVKDPSRDDFYNAFNDKWVVFVPVFMGLDLTEGWSQMMKLQSKATGYKYEVRNTNFDTSAGTRIFNQLIHSDPKPDIIVVQNPDITSYARLEKQAEKEGIFVIQLNMKSLATTAGFVGGDAQRIGVLQARKIVEQCGAGTDTSHKILILNGPTTAPWTVYMQRGYDKVLQQNPELKLVARQSTGNYSSNKAKHITQVVLQQHPDLCGIMGVWDNADVGTVAALKDAGKLDQVFLSTSGGGSATSACQYIKSGVFDHYVSYNVPGQGRDLTNLISVLLQADTRGAKPEDFAMLLYTHLRELTPESIKVHPCWTVDTLRY